MEKEKITEEVNRCLNCKNRPCMNTCPLNNDIPEVIQLVKKEKYEEAFGLISETNVLPAVCGKICPHQKQCQSMCTRKYKGEAITTRHD